MSLREFIVESANTVEHGVCVLHPEGNDFIPVTRFVRQVFVPATDIPLRRAVLHVRKAIRLFEPDIVHTTLFEANTAGRVASHTGRAVVLTSLVNTPYVPEAEIDRDLVAWKRRIVRLADIALSRNCTSHFHAISQAVADTYALDFGLDSANITVVPRGRSRRRIGVPTLQRRQAMRSELGLHPDQPVILSVGRQEAQKGQRYLLEAARVLIGSYPDATFLVAGREGASSRALVELHSELDLGNRVRFLGAREDIGDLLCAADVFAFPSLYEGLGGAVLEAMAMGLPVVASDVPALREVLEHGAAGILVPASDPDALAEGIAVLLSDPSRAGAVAMRALERFEATYSLQASTVEMVRLYERLVAP